MRYYVDTEFNGNEGQLISVAIVREDGAEFYEVLHIHELVLPWVRENVLPVLDKEPTDRATVVKKLQKFLRKDKGPHICIADWPEDLSHFFRLLLRDHGKRNDPNWLKCVLIDLPGFDTANFSSQPHNALADARCLKDHIEAAFSGDRKDIEPHLLDLLR
jgi:hypothetical protein